MMAAMPGSDEADLMSRFAAGDERAVRVLYDRYAGPILTVAMSTLGKRDLADEVVQATMLNAWRAARSFDTSRKLAPWLYAIARRVAIDIHRRESRAARPTEVGESEAAVESLSFERTWEAWEVRSALTGLPDDEREIVRLSHLLGLTHREIAAHLKVPVGTVKSRSARAHRRLAARLRHVVGGPE